MKRLNSCGKTLKKMDNYNKYNPLTMNRNTTPEAFGFKSSQYQNALKKHINKIGTASTIGDYHSQEKVSITKI